MSTPHPRGQQVEKQVRLPVAEVRELSERVLRSAGVPATAARWQADLLIDAELKGQPSHGLLRLPRLVRRIRAGVADPEATGTHTWFGQALLQVDGEQGLGPVVARTALDVVQERVRKTGIAAASIASANHLGMLAWYAEHVAKQGLVCLAVTTSEALVHPYGGRRALIGTNPIAVGVPADPEPFVLDMATSQISMGKVHAHALRDAPLEPGWALDVDGEPTVDPVRAKEGALAPFGGAKGYGLGLAIELMVASLTGTALGTGVTGTLDSVHPSTKGDLFVLMRPAVAPGHLTEYLTAIRNSGADHAVLVPGDRARERRSWAFASGVELPVTLVAELRDLDRA
ncbi:Ldh family oxidoreductase [Streptomyces scabiei]|uniref:Ldh family oxidoreductase n=1 Tax=Streptomyces scabiei TaxID=1930 RepID=UPI0029AC6803|nr:Ldh family oxidoreductase [Streptomyces scabiei]MDX3524725.1 Ldh family oxidoreductase [Streptomyces scabiei]